MTDKEFLQWLHDRCINVYNEPELVDWLWKLREIIKNYDEYKVSY